MYTCLLPMRPHFDSRCNSAIDTPYMGAAEYEFGAPQEVYKFMKYCLKNDLARKVYYSDKYVAICHGKDQDKLREVMKAMSEGKADNVGMPFNYVDWWDESYPDEKPFMWLDIDNKALIAKYNDVEQNGDAFINWLYNYATGLYQKSNEEMHIGQEFTALVRLGARGVEPNYREMHVKVIGIPEASNNITARVVDGKRRFKHLPVHCLREMSLSPA